jgi:hypothetical protein
MSWGRGRSALVFVVSVIACACSPTSGGPPVLPTTLVAGETDIPARSEPPPETAAPIETTPPASVDPGEPPPSSSPGPGTGTAIVAGKVDRSSLRIRATYDVNAAITMSTGELEMATVINVTNESGEGIDRLELNTVAARLGSIKVTDATVDDKPVKVKVDDQTLTVPLGGVLPDGASARIWIVNRAQLRAGIGGSDWMFTRSGGMVAMHRWIPWISASVPFNRPNFGDPFVTPTSPQVDVEIVTDQRVVLASPAAEVVQVAAGTGRAWSFTMKDVRDVSVVLAPDFDVTEDQSAGVPIRVYTRPGSINRDRLRLLASDAVREEERMLGVEFPYETLTVVETQGGGALESPGLVWIPRTASSINRSYLVYHEIAHQWFYGLVGSNQQREPFAEEGPADLLARTSLGILRPSRCGRAALDRPVTAYGSDDCYYEQVQVQGGLVLDDIRLRMGSAKFWKALGDYLEANRLGMGGTRELLDALQEASPVNLMPLLRAWFPSTY